MVLLFKTLVAIISAILFLIAAAVVAFALGLIERPTINVAGSEWGNVNKQQTEIRTNVVVTNPNEFGVTLDDVELGVLVDLNGIRVAKGLTDKLPLPAGQSTTPVVTVIDNSTIPRWWASHVENGEHTVAKITPIVRSASLGRRLVVDTLEQTGEFNTNVLAPLTSDRPESFSVGPYSFMVKSRSLDWGDITNEKAVIEGQVVLYQDSPIAFRAESVDFSFAMNDIPVAQGSAQGPIEVQPGVDTPVQFSAEFSNERLLDWWPTHVQAGEETVYRVQASVTVDTPLGTASADVLDVQDRFRTELLAAFQEEISGRPGLNDRTIQRAATAPK